MAKIKQFTIAVENRPGTVAEVARVLGNAKVNVLCEEPPRERAARLNSSPRMPGGRRRPSMKRRSPTRKPQQRSTNFQTKPVRSRSVWRNSRPEVLI